MPPKPTGEVRHTSAGWVTCIRVAPGNSKGSRQTFKLPTCRDEDEAKARSKFVARLAASFICANVHATRRATELLDMAATLAPALLPGVTELAGELIGNPRLGEPEATAPTFAEVAKDWTDGKIAREFPDHVRAKDSGLDVARLEVLNALDVGGVKFGEIPIDRVTLDHCDRVMRGLPNRARRPGTRRHYAQLVSRVHRLAVYPLKLIPASPIPAGWLPKAGKPPAYPPLYPSDDAALLGHRSTPLVRRVFWGVSVREGARASETLSMRLGYEVDLARGTISLDENKTDDPRTWVAGEDVIRALKLWVKLRNLKRGDLLFTNEDGEAFDDGTHLAELARGDLQAAGVDRPELYEKGVNRGRFRAHDFRGAFVTLGLAVGRSEQWIGDRTGHKSSQMIQRYRRAARSASELRLGWFGPMDQLIPELAEAADCHSIAIAGGNSGGHDRESSIKKDKAEVAEWQTRRTQNPSHPALISQDREITQPGSGAERRLEAAQWQSNGNPEARRLWDAALVQALRARATELAAELPAGAVERALHDALTAATAERRWSDVAQLASELEARRRARASTVNLGAERAKRGGSR